MPSGSNSQVISNSVWLLKVCVQYVYIDFIVVLVKTNDVDDDVHYIQYALVWRRRHYYYYLKIEFKCHKNKSKNPHQQNSSTKIIYKRKEKSRRKKVKTTSGNGVAF